MSKMAKTPQLKSGEHIFIGGMNGCGKSVLAEKIASSIPDNMRLAILDTKGDMSLRFIPPEKVTVIKELKDIPFCNTPIILYQPVWEELNQDYYNSFYEWCYKHKNIFVWTDEIFSICDNPTSFPPFYKAILTRGRSLKVTHIGLSQRPSGIPLISMSEAVHFYIFTLNLEEDRKRLVKVTGQQIFINNPPFHTFRYWNSKNQKDPAILGKLRLK